MTVTATDRPADPVPCGRCGTGALLTIADRCADCVADIGLHHPGEHDEWRREVHRRYG